MEKDTFREACIKAYDILWACYKGENTTPAEEKVLLKLLNLIDDSVVPDEEYEAQKRAERGEYERG